MLKQSVAPEVHILKIMKKIVALLRITNQAKRLLK
jgi:hypothetical protein